MSTGQLSRQRSTSRSSSVRSDSKLKPPTPSITPGSDEFAFEPCAATASFLLYAQRNIILCVHHDTLAIERRFHRHREDVSWISVDNVSERGAGRLVVSYDAGSTAIVWDLFTGDEVARFASYEQIRVASWMKNGNVAFGNAQGNIILFEPSTSEHLSARTIFDPITALAPAADCRTFAIGYLNGSILIATLQPSFTILHTLTTPRAPSPIAGLAWHGSSSKQKSEMLAAQTSDGDLRVWSVPKVPHGGDTPCVIRILNQKEQREPGPCWFAWSKNGRIVQYTEGQTCAWDVRTKRVSYEPVPTIDGVAAICNYGPTATLFTMGRNYSVQQYDLNPSGAPVMVANVQHHPANTPPSPPNSLDEKKKKKSETPVVPSKVTKHIRLESDSSEGEGANVISPLQKIAQEMDQLEEERRDRVGPLSPVSSRGSQSSRSSGGSRGARYRYDKPLQSTRSTKSSGGTGTVFSSGTSSFVGTSRESISIRSASSATSSRFGGSGLRKEVLRSPDELLRTKNMDLFPFTKARLSDVPYRNPQLGPDRSPDDLRQNMLRVVFGWENDIEELIRDELARHQPGSAAAILLSKWLGDIGADLMASMVGSESMTSSDWMLLALSAMGQDTQKKVGEAFVQRLLEKGDIHPAVAILLGLGEHNEAIEVYVSRNYFMEAILLTCLIFPTDWQRQSFLVRKWGEAAISHGRHELAVKCFSCMGLESSEPWFSPRAQDAVFEAQKQHLLGSAISPPLSPPSVQSSRITTKMSALKLVTDFGHGPRPQQMIPEEDEETPMYNGVTPIAESAISPAVGKSPWLSASTVRPARGSSREPTSARTATPKSYQRQRYPSKSDADRPATNNESLASLIVPDRRLHKDEVPRTAIDNIGREAETLPFSTRRPSSTGGHKEVILTAATYDPSKPTGHLPSPAAGVFETLSNKEAESRGSSRSRKPDGLHLEMKEKVVEQGLGTSDTGYMSNLSPPLTGASVKSAKARSIDQYISSLEEANYYSARKRAESRTEPRPASRTSEGRPASRTTERARSRNRDASESRGRAGVRYIRPAKRSPSSPVPMSPEDAGIYLRDRKEAATNTENFDDERYYKVNVASPIATESVGSNRTNRSRARTGASKTRSSSKVARRTESPEEAPRARSRGASRASSRRAGDDRGRSSTRGDTSALRSPQSPHPMPPVDAVTEDYEPVRPRQRSTSRRPGERGTSSRREPSPDRRLPRDRSMSRKASSSLRESSRTRVNFREPSPERATDGRPESRHSNVSGRSGQLSRPSTKSRRELAAKELEERRLSLARRPSAPVIPLPGELHRPAAVERSHTDTGDYLNTLSMHRDPIQRSQTADPDISKKYSPTNKLPVGATSTTSVPIGLPATPRAMRHTRYMSADPNEREGIPAVPSIPDNIAQYSDSQGLAADNLGPLLPATTFGQPIGIGLGRSSSAPPEDMSPTPQSKSAGNSPVTSQHPQVSRRGSLGGRTHTRVNTLPDLSQPSNYKRISPPPITASIDETLHENQVVILEQDLTAPPLLSELQHLASPPPPPPPPVFSQSPKSNLGVINIAIEENPGEKLQETVSTTSSPVHTHRRGRNSVSENLGMTFKRVTERMRSTSRSRNKSPPMREGVSPYESVPPFSFPRSASARSPVDGTNDQFGSLTQPSASAFQSAAQVGTPVDEKQNPQFQGYKHPREIRANMPPEQLQQGVYQAVEPPMI